MFKVGDIAIALEASIDVTIGGEYVVKRVIGTQISFVDNGGDVRVQPTTGFRLKEKTMDNLQIGDKIVRHEGGGEREIVAVGPKYAVTLDIYDGTNDARMWTTAELKEEFVMKPEAVELTLEQIADKFGIAVENIKIKK